MFLVGRCFVYITNRSFTRRCFRNESIGVLFCGRSINLCISFINQWIDIPSLTLIKTMVVHCTFTYIQHDTLRNDQFSPYALLFENDELFNCCSSNGLSTSTITITHAGFYFAAPSTDNSFLSSDSD